MCPTNNLAEIDSPLLTALYSLHTSLNGKMVVFAGYSMPMQFTGGIKAEHLHTRAHAGLFDVSQVMAQQRPWKSWSPVTSLLYRHINNAIRY